jgi:hypothetical protein
MANVAASYNVLAAATFLDITDARFEQKRM